MAAPHAPRNYEGSINPFGLPDPPEWFLRELDLFDAALVIVPGQIRREYLLGRRTRVPQGLRALVQTSGAFVPHPNTLRLTELGLVPVCTIHILPNDVQWSQKFFHDLAARDTWRLGGANRIADELESHEQSAEAKQRRDSRDELDARSGDAYKSWQYRSGLRVSMALKDRGQQIRAAGERAPSATTA